MKMKCYFAKDGTLLNIGEWDQQIRPAHTEPDVIEPAVDVPAVTVPDVRNRAGKVVREAFTRPAFTRPAQLITKGREIPELIQNPIPEGVEVRECEVTETEHGRFLASDYASLRKPEYPAISDQLDALWKIICESKIAIPEEAQAIVAQIQDTKAKFPKS